MYKNAFKVFETMNRDTPDPPPHTRALFGAFINSIVNSLKKCKFESKLDLIAILFRLREPETQILTIILYELNISL